MNFEEKSFNYAKMPPKYSNLERFIKGLYQCLPYSVSLNKIFV